MKRIVFVVVVLLLSLIALAGPSDARKGSANMEKLKSLVGTWEGKEQDGKLVRLSYKLVSDGSALMETMDNAEHKESMITMYHLDGDKLMMTHYCSMGNQPRMKVTSSNDKSVTFSFVDGTNLSSTADAHMHKLVITWVDKDHITQEWTMQSEGKDSPPVTFKLERKG